MSSGKPDCAASSMSGPEDVRGDLPAVVGEAVAGAVVVIEVADHPLAAGTAHVQP